MNRQEVLSEVWKLKCLVKIFSRLDCQETENNKTYFDTSRSRGARHVALLVSTNCWGNFMLITGLLPEHFSCQATHLSSECLSHSSTFTETHWKPIFECYTKYLNNFKDHLMLIEPDKCENCNQFTKHSIFSVLISLYSFQNALISCFHWVKCYTPWGVQEIYITFQSNIKTQNTQINRHKAFIWSCPTLAFFNLVSRINL